MKGRRGDRLALLVLFVLMIVTTAASIRYGAIDFSVHEMGPPLRQAVPEAPS